MSITLTILLVSGTLAQYTGSVTSRDNSLEAGRLILYMHGNGDDVSTIWTINNMMPGKSQIKSKSLQLYNYGDIPANNVEILFNNVCTKSDGTASGDAIRKYLEITNMEYTLPDNSQIELVDGNGKATDNLYAAIPGFDPYKNNLYVDLEDLDGKTLKELPAPPIHGDVSHKHCEFAMDVYFDKSATNDCQGTKCELTLAFTMHQV